MRTTSSFRLVGTPEPPLNVPRPSPLPRLVSPELGKIPAPRRAVAFGLIMQLGITFPGNGCPGIMVAGLGLTPPGQLANRYEDATPEGTLIGEVTVRKLPR